MRLLWQSFVDRTQNAAYFECLGAHPNKLAAPGTSVDLAGISPPNALAAEEQGYDGFVVGHFQDGGSDWSPSIPFSKSGIPSRPSATGCASASSASRVSAPGPLKSAEMRVALHEGNGLEPSRGPSLALAPQRAIKDFRDFVAKGPHHD